MCPLAGGASLAVVRNPEARRALDAARAIGAAGLVLLGQFAVDAPGAWPGAAGETTLAGALLATAAAAAALLAVVGSLLGRRWGPPASAVLYALGLGQFVPLLPFDPVVAGGLVGWNLLLLAGRLSGGRPPALVRPPRDDEDDAVSAWLAVNGPAMRHTLSVALLATVGVVGLRLASGTTALIVCLVLGAGALGYTLPFTIVVGRGGRRLAALLAVPLILAGLAGGEPAAALALLAVHHAAALLMALARGPTVRDALDHFLRRPAALSGVTFLAFIALGTLLLSFPAASAGPRAISPLDALFTATSAVCVTGLVVLDTPTAFSGLGQAVILGLIQVGGLGIIVLSAFGAVALGGRLGLAPSRALADLLEHPGTADASRLARFIVLSTLAMEGLGALALAAFFAGRGVPVARSLWLGSFHAVSAFCNAGFALWPDSLVGFQTSAVVLGVVALLVVLGGLGFPFLAAVVGLLRGRLRARLGVQARIVGWTTVVLTVVGFVGIAAVEWDASLSGLSTGYKLLNALFQSVTLRTAGFNSVDMAAQRTATGLLMDVLMFIGGSPGGTAGGIKTTTLLVLVAAVWSISRGRTDVVVAGRTVPRTVVYRSAAITAVSLSIAVSALFALLLTQQSGFDVLAFEVASALGTVGLSLGGTARLDSVGRLIVITVMFVGRVGPLSVALLVGQGRQARVAYPESRLMVG